MVATESRTGIIEAGKIIPQVVEEINRVNVLTERVKKRKHECLTAIPHLCAERSRLVTQSWRDTEGQPLVLRRAQLFKKIMEGITVSIWDDELIVGSQTRYLRGGSPAIDYSTNSLKATFEAEKITIQGEVTEGLVNEEEKRSLLEDLYYWDGKAPGDILKKLVLEKLQLPFEDYMDAHMFSDAPFAWPAAGRSIDYEKIMEHGINGVRKKIQERISRLDFSTWGDWQKYEFLQACLICCDAVVAFAARHAKLAREKAKEEKNPTRRKELENIAEICDWVPANPPRTFYEALQCTWLLHLANDLEAPTGGEPLGRLDQYLFQAYKKDIEGGRLTRQKSAELLGCLWVKLCETETIYSLHDRQIGQGSQFQDVTIGGVTKEGKDATNDLTFMILEVTRQMKMNQPPIYIRYHQGISEEIMFKAIETNRDHGAGMPAFMNDGPTMLKLTDRGVPITDAREWICGGCISIVVPSGVTCDPGFMFNKIKAFELALHNGIEPRSGKLLGLQTGDIRSFKSYNELYQAFLKQVEYMVDIFKKTWNLCQQMRAEIFTLPYASLTIDDCIETGNGFLQGGMRYPWLKGDYADVGHQNVSDSLTAIKKLVFEDKRITMDELLNALDADFEGKEALRQMLISAPKYGNDDNYADDVFNAVSLDASRIMAQPDMYGKPMHICRGGASQHYWAGNTISALPDGRKAWQPTADANLSPAQGMDTHGPTAVLLSATKVNQMEYAMTTLLNMKVMPSTIRTKEGMRKLLSLIKTYFDRGGWHVQFNMIDPTVLLDAKKHPEKHRELVVRVAGYSAYFVELTAKVQDEIIARTLHSV